MDENEPFARYIGIDRDEVYISLMMDGTIRFTSICNGSDRDACLRPQEARRAALHILALCDKIEGKNATD